MIAAQQRGKVKMKRLFLKSLVLSSGLLFFFTLSGQAQYFQTVTVYNVDFSSETYGTEPTLGPAVYSSPPVGTNVYGAGYDGNVSGFTAQQNHTIGDVSGLTKALIMSNTAPAGSHVNWVDTQFNPTGGSAIRPVMGRLEFDLAPVSQGGPATDNGGFRSDWAIVAFNNVTASPAWVFAMSHAIPGQLEMENAFPVNVAIGSYTNGLVTHVRIDSYMEGAGYYDVYFNGVLAAYRFPYRNPMVSPADQISEFFIQEPGTVNTVVGFDNLTYTLFIPEPSSLVLSSIGLISFAALSRRYRRH